jgi:hypothetical protein
MDSFLALPLCMSCIQNTGAHTAVSCDPGAACAVCGSARELCKPAGPRDVEKAFQVYFERLQMALARAAAKPPAAQPILQPKGRFNRQRLP